MTSTDIVINAEGTDATNYHPEDRVKELEREVERLKEENKELKHIILSAPKL